MSFNFNFLKLFSNICLSDSNVCCVGISRTPESLLSLPCAQTCTVLISNWEGTNEKSKSLSIMSTNASTTQNILLSVCLAKRSYVSFNPTCISSCVNL